MFYEYYYFGIWISDLLYSNSYRLKIACSSKLPTTSCMHGIEMYNPEHCFDIELSVVEIKLQVADHHFSHP